MNYTSPVPGITDNFFASQDKHSFITDEFFWSGRDYSGEPSPYYSVRSYYCSVIDLAGFKKNLFYPYQSGWKPDLPIEHLLPDWNFSNCIAEIMPVHFFIPAMKQIFF